MRPTRDTFTVETTLGADAESIRMGIAEGGEQFIMSILTDMYADRELAALREYATNARDAHVAANKADVPIRVELPTDLRPMLLIRDEGIGMTAEDIRRTYSQYAASTKRDSDEFNGVLGIGSKAALTYADQFSVIGRKDGRQVTVAITRDEDGAGVANILDERDTDAPNGVEVQIPARRDNEFADRASYLFAYWPSGTALVNGEEPEPLDAYELAPGMRIADKSHATRGERCVVVMGGVPYPAPRFFERTDDDITLAYHKALVIDVEIGDVHFAPSREALMDTPTTQRTLDAWAERFRAAKAGAVQAAVDQARDSREAVLAMLDAQDALSTERGASWGGEDVPDIFQAPTGETWRYVMDQSRYYRRHRSASDTIRQIQAKPAVNAVWVLGFTNATWTGAMRDKLDRYCGPDGPAQHVRAEDGETEFILTSGDELSSPWLEGVETLRWADVRSWKDPNAPTTGGTGESYAGTYCVRFHNTWYTRYAASDLAEDADDGHPLYYMIGSTARWSVDGQAEESALRKREPEVRVIILPKPRLAKFLRQFPSARPADEGLREIAAEWARGLTVPERNAIVTHARWHYYSRPPTFEFDTQLALDERFAVWNRTASAYTRELHDAWELHRRHLPKALSGVRVEDPSDGDDYPLLAADPSDEAGRMHLLMYVNAVYSQREESQ